MKSSRTSQILGPDLDPAPRQGWAGVYYIAPDIGSTLG